MVFDGNTMQKMLGYSMKVSADLHSEFSMVCWPNEILKIVKFSKLNTEP